VALGDSFCFSTTFPLRTRRFALKGNLLDLLSRLISLAAFVLECVLVRQHQQIALKHDDSPSTDSTDSTEQP
jgi:hypothetical protein